MARERGTALVTGGAVRIGRAICVRLAREGYAIAIHCNSSRDAATALADAIRASGARAAVVAADLADPEAVAGLLPQAESALGPVTCLVNNASSFLIDDVRNLDVAVWNRQFSVNVRAPSVLAGALANALPEGRAGNVVNILDQRVWKLTPQYYSYTLTKAAMLAATTTMAQALAPRIRVNAVGPGPTMPSVHDGPEGLAQEAAGTLLGHSVNPDDIAAAVAYLLDARSITGQMIAVDAGQHLAWQTPDIVDPAS